MELRPRKIAVYAVFPGPVDPEMSKDAERQSHLPSDDNYIAPS